eukprot:15350514-Alexandrium_andersonii.AAC.1
MGGEGIRETRRQIYAFPGLLEAGALPQQVVCVFTLDPAVRAAPIPRAKVSGALANPQALHCHHGDYGLIFARMHGKHFGCHVDIDDFATRDVGVVPGNLQGSGTCSMVRKGRRQLLGGPIDQ